MNTPFRVFRRCFQIALFGTFSLVVLSCTKLFAENAVSTPQASQSEKMPVVTLAGLLNEMVDYDSVARWPEPAFTVRQASSYDRSRIAPDKPGWFANNDGSNYIRTEVHAGREERVMLDADGPGAIVRFFLTSGGSRAARIRVYLDGAETPTIEWPTFDLLDGGPNVGEPLCSRHPAPLGHGGSTLYLPIPYAHHCKVTVEEADPAHPGARYYHIDYRTYARSADVETFSSASLKAASPIIDRVNRLLSEPPVPSTTKTVGFDCTLPSGGAREIELPAGPSAVRQLELSVGANLSPAAREQALRSVVIQGAFDGEAGAIWCPVGDFIGSGAGGRPLASWYRTVDEHGQAVCRWTMPYHEHGRLALQNLGDRPVRVKLTAHIGSWAWDDRSLYFHGNWRQQTRIPARPFRDWNFVTVADRGVLVGDVMSVYNPLPSWYGEGNEKIWVDGEPFPSHIGTGTEDYYNASWAPNPVYQTPFTNHPRIDDPLSQGQNVYTRSRNLDAVPFDQSLQFDFEIETWRDSVVDYSATTYWYGAAGAHGGVGPQPAEARKPVPSLPAPMVIQGALECESMTVVDHSAGLIVEPQDMRGFDSGGWSNHCHLLIRGRQAGDYVELAIPVKGATPQRVTLYATQAYDYGILKFTVNGSPVDDAFDGYAPNPTPSGPIPLGVFTPKHGQLILRAELIGSNPATGGARYLAALDAVVVSDR
jgi:hypothetical protein